jgi:hypothetical protein
MYGQPANYDRGSGGAGPSHGQITPKDTEHSVWDDVDEILGSPTLLGKSAGQGSTVPGTGGGWATNPAKPWDESELEESELRPGDEDDERLSAAGIHLVEPSVGNSMQSFQKKKDLGSPESAWDLLDLVLKKM